MEKIVVSYNESDGCTYSFEVVQPVEYDSIEKFYCDFEDALKTACRVKSNQGSFGPFDFEHFMFQRNDKKWDFVMPEIQTLDEWFEKEKKDGTAF